MITISPLKSWVIALLLFPLILVAQTQVELPAVSTVGGKYDIGFPLSISTVTPNTNLFYTLDGDEPTESSIRYTSPIRIDKNTTLRIKGFAVGLTPSKTATQSYFIGTTHTFPIVALSFKKSDFFNDTTGIYVKYENGLDVPGNIELFEAGAKTATFNQLTAFAIQGSTSAQLPQKSLEIKASGSYSALPYKIFPDLAYTSYKRLVLRNGGQDWGITLFRDELATSLALKISDLNGIISKPNLDMQDFRPSVVYFNGEYWGIHGLRERMNKYYVEQHFNLKSADYDLIENWGGEIKNGDSIAFTSFYKSLPSRNLSDNTAFEQFKTELDVPNFLDYNVFNVFIDNTDWPSNNVRCFRLKTGGKWRFISFDHDFSFGLFQITGGWNTGDARQNSLARLFNATDFNWPNAANATLLFRKCMENGNFRRDFINRMADMMNTLFKPTRISQKINEFKTQYQPEMERHAARWGSPFGILWQANIEKMRNFGNQRMTEVMSHVQQQFSEVTGTASVTVAAMPVNGGSVNFSTLNLTPSVMPFTGTYFTGVDIPVTAVPAAGYVFRGWSDPTLGTSPTINVRLSAAKNITAIFELSNPCSVDIQKPVLQNCPPNITLTTTQNCATTTWTAPTAIDNCTATPSVSSNFLSGFCFPLGSTTVVYTASDNAGNTTSCQFTVQVNQQIPTGNCKKYTVADVNNFCGCAAQQWLPYAILLDPIANSTNCLGTRINAQSVEFQQNIDGTATLKGSFRDANWTPIVVDIQLSGGTSTPPAGAPFRNFCMQSQPLSATNGWFYYPQMTGTYKFGANAALPITLGSTPFEVGVGANQQRIELLGASAKFIIGGISTGQFNFVLNNEQTVSCSGGGINPCDTDTQPPVLSNCPQNTSVNTSQTCATVAWTVPTVTDNCTTTPSVSANFINGSCFPIGTTTVIYTATDARNNTVTCGFNVVVQRTISTADLALSLTSNQPSYVKYTTINVQVVAKNIGNQPLTNIRVNFNYPVGTVNGGVLIPSVGTWSAFCGNIQCNEWTIPSLAAGATATLTVPLFVINTATTINATALLLASTPTDQNIANNQASLLIPQRTIVNASVAQKATQKIPVVIQKISPNPTTDGAINVELESISEREVTFVFYNSLGKILKTEIRKVESGRNKLFFDVLDFETGIYLIVPTTNLGRHVPTKFVKM